MMNIRKIKELEKKQVDLSSRLADQLSRLNKRLTSVVSNNNKLNIGNMKSILDKVEDLNDRSSRSDVRMQNEIESLRKKLTYLIENDEVYSLIMKEKENQANEEETDDESESAE
jgi:hypothetical protein